MARAKSTVRAEARRRYRNSQVATAADEGGLPDDAPADATEAPPEGGRRGLLGFQRPDVAGDLRAFPTIVRTQRSFWLALAIISVATVVGIVVPRITGRVDGWLVLVLQLCLYVPSIPLLIAGYFAPRGAWLVGLSLGVLSSVGYLLVAIGAAGAVGGNTLAGVNASEVVGTVTYWLGQGIFFGAIFGGLAAWYRRWLRASGQNARRQREERERQKRKAAKQQARAR